VVERGKEKRTLRNDKRVSSVESAPRRNILKMEEIQGLCIPEKKQQIHANENSEFYCKLQIFRYRLEQGILIKFIVLLL
jgi:hypothetical protein